MICDDMIMIEDERKSEREKSSLSSVHIIARWSFYSRFCIQEKSWEKKFTRRKSRKRQWKLNQYRQQESLNMNMNMNKHFWRHITKQSFSWITHIDTLRKAGHPRTCYQMWYEGWEQTFMRKKNTSSSSIDMLSDVIWRLRTNFHEKKEHKFKLFLVSRGEV